MRTLTLPFLSLLAACSSGGKAADPVATDDSASSAAEGGGEEGGGEEGGGEEGGGEGGGDADLDAYLVALAGQVSEDELSASIGDLADLGTRYTGTDGNAAALVYLTGRLEGYGYVVEADPFSFSGTDATNLVARLEGAEDPDSVYVFSAHYDSTSDEAWTDAPGADDNASGVAAVLAAARLLVDQPHRASLWFVLTGAEEQGSRGSAHLVEWLAAEPVMVRGAMAPDMIGYWPLGEGDAFDILGDEDSEHLVEHMAAVADLLGVANKTWIEHGYCYGDDHTNFQDADIPAISPMDCVEAHNVRGSGEDTPHYHRTSDTLETLHMPFTRDVAGVLVATLSAWGEPVLDSGR